MTSRAAITDVVLRYASAVDGRDWELFGSCFTDPVFLNFVSFSPTSAEEMPRSAWVARLEYQVVDAHYDLAYG